MATEELVEQTYSVPRESRATRTFLGGMLLNSRVSLFVFFGLLAIVAMGGLFFAVDQRLTGAVNALNSSNQVASLVNRLETAAIAVNSDSSNFISSPNAKFAESYNRQSDDAAALLAQLQDIPAALDGQKMVTTLADGITQHATHFQNLVSLQSLLGADQTSGLYGNAAVTGTELETRIRNTSAPRLISQISALRQLERRLQAKVTPEDAKAISDAVTNLKQTVTAATLPPADKTILGQSINSYSADVDQLAKTRLLQSNEAARLDEVNAYVAPNLATLIKFSSNLSDVARFDVETARTDSRRILAGGATIIMLVLMLIGTLLLRSMAKPISDLANAALQLAHGNHSVSIPALGNYDETGDVANALTFFRENMAQAHRLRQELEVYLKGADTRVETTAESPAAEMVEPATPAPDAPTPMQDGEEEASPKPDQPSAPDESEEFERQETIEAAASELLSDATGQGRAPLSHFSQQVAQTSQNASNAAKDAEKCDIMVTGLADSLEKIDEIELLMASISDQMSLLAVQTALSNETSSDDPENLILLSEKRLGEDGERTNSQSVNDRIETLQSGTKRAIRAIQQIGKTIEEVNEVAVEFAADASNDALEAATELLKQSEDLRGMLDELLGRIKTDGQAESGS